MKTIGFIDYYLDQFHANKYPEWIVQASVGWNPASMDRTAKFSLNDKEGTNRCVPG